MGNLLDRLDQLESDLKSLQVRSAATSIESITSVYETDQVYDLEQYRATKKTEFAGEFRLGVDYSKFISQSVVSRITDDAEQSLQRLEELLAEVEQIVEESGSEEAREIYEEALLFRNEAEADLGNGDEESALQNMNIAESLALEASRLAGNEITSSLEDEEWDVFSELSLEWEAATPAGLYWRFRSRTREGDEYFQQRLDGELEISLGPEIELLLRDEFRFRDYQDELLDDFIDNSLFTRLEWEANEHLTFRVENVFDFKTEYKADPNEGYLSDSPKLLLQYEWGNYHLFELEYDYRRQDYLSDEEEEFNSRRHNLRQAYHYFSAQGWMQLEAEQEWKNYNKADEEDDYRNLFYTAEISYDVLLWMTWQIRGEKEDRQYSLLGRTNTDYEQWVAEPEIQFRWSDVLFQSLRYTRTSRRYLDRDGTDGIEKIIGNYREHRVALETWWSPSDRFSLSATADRQWRRYQNEQTGEYEIYLPDYRPISNYVRCSVSLFCDWEIMDRLTLSGSLYQAWEEHDRFDSYDVEETTANFEIRYEF